MNILKTFITLYYKVMQFHYGKMNGVESLINFSLKQ